MQHFQISYLTKQLLWKIFFNLMLSLQIDKMTAFALKERLTLIFFMRHTKLNMFWSNKHIRAQFNFHIFPIFHIFAHLHTFTLAHVHTCILAGPHISTEKLSVSPSVHPSIRQSVHPSVKFQFIELLTQLKPKNPEDWLFIVSFLNKKYIVWKI